MDLFGSNILDFPDPEQGSMFLERLPRLSESELFPEELGLGLYTGSNKVSLLEDDEESNDSAVYSDELASSDDASSEVINDDIGLLNDEEDSYMSAVAFDQICKAIETRDTQQTHQEEDDLIEADIIEDNTAYNPSEGGDELINQTSLLEPSNSLDNHIQNSFLDHNLEGNGLLDHNLEVYE